MGPFFSQNVPFCAKKYPLSKIYQKPPYNTKFENVPQKLPFFLNVPYNPNQEGTFSKMRPQKKGPIFKNWKNSNYAL